MPGFRLSRLRRQSTTCWSSSRMSGRGPTRLISPRTTFRSCGSSSIEKRRSHAPTRVTRGSFGILNMRGSPSSQSCLFRCGDSVLPLLGVRGHRAELEDLERLVAAAHAELAEEDRAPCESSLIQSATSSEQGGEKHEAEDGERQVHGALEVRPTSARAGAAGSPISGRPSAVWMPTFVPITSKKRGTRSIWMSRSFSERMRSSISSWESFEKATITRSTSRTRTSCGSCSGPPRSARSSRLARRSLGRSSTKPTRLSPYSGCWRSFFATSWPTSPAPTMIVFWR